MSRLTCELCTRGCALAEGQIGFCRARGNVDGSITAINYGLVTSLALDPIEKKPLYRFYPGSKILSVGSFGCNLRCRFCQNHEISMADAERSFTRSIRPAELVEMARSLVPSGNIGIAYTYNEPLIGYEYVRDCAGLAQKEGLKNVLVTNGYICEKPLRRLLPFIDALNIDLKAFNEDFYKWVGGDLATVKRSIELSAAASHVEVTTLVIPGKNDSAEEIRSLAQWLSAVDPEIPLHLTRFFPRYQLLDRETTPLEKLCQLADIAREYLRYVYLGNC